MEVADHPILRGMGTELTFRRNVAGFFAPGHHPVPPGAEVLTRLFGGEPATYLDRVSTAGSIVVQATSNLLSYCGEALIDWIVGEAAQRRAEAAGQRRGLAAVYGGSAQHHRTLTAPKYARHLTGGTIYLPELADVDLTEYRGLLIPERSHRGQLERAAGRITELLDSGGTVIAFSGGEPLPEFCLACAGSTDPPTSGGGSPTRRTPCSGGLPCVIAPGTITASSNPRKGRKRSRADHRRGPTVCRPGVHSWHDGDLDIGSDQLLRRLFHAGYRTIP